MDFSRRTTRGHLATDDIKIAGITEEIMRVALAQAKDGRLHILGEMNKALPTPLELASSRRDRNDEDPTDKIREVIAPAAK